MSKNTNTTMPEIRFDLRDEQDIAYESQADYEVPDFEPDDDDDDIDPFEDDMFEYTDEEGNQVIVKTAKIDPDASPEKREEKRQEMVQEVKRWQLRSSQLQ